jgi:D-serine deaminase-like pyridoxal phosphate-dependent protein
MPTISAKVDRSPMADVDDRILRLETSVERLAVSVSTLAESHKGTQITLDRVLSAMEKRQNDDITKARTNWPVVIMTTLGVLTTTATVTVFAITSSVTPTSELSNRNERAIEYLDARSDRSVESLGVLGERSTQNRQEIERIWDYILENRAVLSGQ